MAKILQKFKFTLTRNSLYNPRWNLLQKPNFYLQTFFFRKMHNFGAKKILSNISYLFSAIKWTRKKSELGFPYCFPSDFHEEASWTHGIFFIWCHDKKKFRIRLYQILYRYLKPLMSYRGLKSWKSDTITFLDILDYPSDSSTNIYLERFFHKKKLPQWVSKIKKKINDLLHSKIDWIKN